MIGQIAAVTHNMRVGSGGVMLPNHAPLMVAERFKVLEALFPGRIDLGIGRAPGTDHVTSIALRRRQDIATTTTFSTASRNCCCSKTTAIPTDHPFRNVQCDAERRRAAADLPARLERLLRAARSSDRRRLLLRASFLGARSGRRDAALSREVPALAVPAEAAMRSSRPRPSSRIPTKRPTGLPPPST